MKKIILLFSLLALAPHALAGLPPTTSKGSADASNVTTFFYQFPQMNAVHTGVTASLTMPNFVGDSGTGGIAGLVPSPSPYSAQDGDFLSAGGNFSYVDQSKTIQPSFSFVATGSAPSGAIKYENTVIFTSITTGKPYAIGTGFIGTPTLSLWDISDQTSPVNVGNITEAGGGIYNVSVVTLSGVQYAIVGYNSGSKFVVFNITNPANPTQTSSTVVTGSPGSIYGVSCPSSGAGYGYCYLGTQSAGLVVMDLTSTGTPAAPAQVFTQGGSNKSFGVVAVGSNVYTTLYSTSTPYTVRQIVSWSISTPSTPSQLQSLQVTQQGEALGLSVFGNTAFVTTASSGHYYTNLVDITTPSSMTNLSNVTSSNNFGSAFYAVASGNVMYVSSGSNATYGGAIDAYDISTRTNPVHIAQTTEGVANDVFGNPALYGGYIFVANYGNSAGTSGNLQVYTQVINSPISDNITTYSETIASATPSMPLQTNGSNQIVSGAINLGTQVTGITPVVNGGTGTSTAPSNGQILIGNGTGYTVANIVAGSNITVTNSSGGITISSASGSGSLNARWTLNDAVVPYINIDGPNYQTSTTSLTSVYISMLNCGSTGSTVIRVNQNRGGSLLNSATASLPASTDANEPCGASENLSGTLSLQSGDIETVDVVSVSGGDPESITVQY